MSLLEHHASRRPEGKGTRLRTGHPDSFYCCCEGRTTWAIIITIKQTDMELKLDFHFLKFLLFVHQQRTVLNLCEQWFPNLATKQNHLTVPECLGLRLGKLYYFKVT